MYWLVKTNSNQLEIWSESEQQFRLMKCEYYGAKPFWENIRKISPPGPDQHPPVEVGEVIPYRQSKIGKHFAVIIELFYDQGQKKFKGIDIFTRKKIVAPVIGAG
jgi:hypothetical protein